jgi:hypothetical protein
MQDEPGGAVYFSCKMSLERRCWVLIIKMQAGEPLSLEKIQAFLEGSQGVDFKSRHRVEVYEWVNQTLQQIRYQDLKRSGRGLVRRYVSKMTGLSRAQSTSVEFLPER